MFSDWMGISSFTRKPSVSASALSKEERQLALQLAQQHAPVLPVALQEGQDELVGLLLKNLAPHKRLADQYIPIIPLAPEEEQDELLEILLKSQADHNPLSSIDAIGDPLLHQAVRHGDYPKAIEKILKGSQNLDRRDKEGNSALHVAIAKHHNKAFDLLLTAAFERDYKKKRKTVFPIPRQRLELINQKNRLGETPLLLACKTGNTYAAHQLLNQGADPNVQDIDGNTPLMYAAQRFDSAMIIRLIKHGAKGGTTNQKGETAFIQFLKDTAHPDLSRIPTNLCHMPVYIYRLWRRDQVTFHVERLAEVLLKIITPPFSTEQRKDLVETLWLKKPIVNRLEKRKVNLIASLAFQDNSTDEQGHTLAMRLLQQLQSPLSRVEAKYKEKMLVQLIQSSRNINQQDAEGKTLLMHLLETTNPLKWIIGTTFLPRLLRQNLGAHNQLNVALSDRNGNGALHYLAKVKNTETRLPIRGRVLRKAMLAGTWVKPNWHQTIRDFLPSDNRAEILANGFLQMGFNPKLTNNRLETAAMIAAQNGNLPVLNVLLEKCPETLNQKDRTGKTTLMHAVLNKQTEVIQQLCQIKELDKKATDYKGKTAFDYAKEMGLSGKICSQLKPT